MGCSTSKENDTHSKDEKRKRSATVANNNANQPPREEDLQYISPAADATATWTSESTAPPSLAGGDSSTATPAAPSDDVPLNPHGHSSRNRAVRNPLLSSPQHLYDDELVVHPLPNHNNNHSGMMIVHHDADGEGNLTSNESAPTPPPGVAVTTNRSSVVHIHGVNNSFTNNSSSTALEFEPMSPFSRPPTRTGSSITTTTTRSATTNTKSKCSTSSDPLHLLIGGSNSHRQDDGTLSACSQEQQVIVDIMRNSAGSEQEGENPVHTDTRSVLPRRESINTECSASSFPLLGLEEAFGRHTTTTTTGSSSSRLNQQLASKKTFSLGDHISTHVASLTSTPSPSVLSSRSPPPTCRSLNSEAVAFQLPNPNTHSELSVHGLIPPIAAGKGTTTETGIPSALASVQPERQHREDSPPLPTLTPPLKEQDHQTAMAAAVAARDRLLHFCREGGNGSSGDGGSSSSSSAAVAADRMSSSSPLILHPRSTSSSW